MSDDTPKGLAGGLTNYGDPEFSLYLRRSFARSMGYSREHAAAARSSASPTRASGFNNCHRHFPELIEAVKRGVLAAGGLPLEFPTISLGEVFLSPTSLMFRNLMAMDVEEMVRGAADGRGGAGRRLRQDGAGAADGRGLGRQAGDPARRRADDDRPLPRRAARRLHGLPPLLGAATAPARSTDAEIERIEGNLATTAGTCAVMGTASTMACIAEALGMALPGTAAIPAVHADRLRAAEATGAPRASGSSAAISARSHHHAESGRECAARAARDRRLDQRGHPSHRHRRAPGLALSLDAAQRSCRRRRRCWSISSRSASTTWRISTPRAACGAVLRELQAAARISTASTVDRRDAGRAARAPADAWVDRDGDPRRSTIRSSRWAGSSRCSARWRRTARSSSARRPTRALFEKRGPRGGLRLARGPRGAHRRSGSRRRRRTISWCCRTPGRRRRRHARGRLPADPAEARRARASRTWCASPTRG